MDQDCSFDLLVVTVTSGAVVAAYLFPWALFFAVADPDWSRGINAELYRTVVPADIDPEHLQ